jgi:iron-sulfur cluster assembly protein
MINLTTAATDFLKDLIEAEGATEAGGIRIQREAYESGVAVGFAVVDEPDLLDDEVFEHEGLRIFVEDALVDSLDGRTLDVLDVDCEPELVWR